MFGRNQGLRAMRQCREGVGLSIEQWYGDGVEMVVHRSQDRNLALDGNGVECVGMVLKLDQLLLYT